jgi:HK97 family phage portal protein
MAIFDIFNRKGKGSKESNTLFGQTALGNNVLRNISNAKQIPVSNQLLYVTTSSVTESGRIVDMSVLSRNSTVMSCVGVKARALAQLPIKIMAYNDKGLLVDALLDESVGPRDQIKAKQVASLLMQPNNFQSSYEYWYQFVMWLDLAGEVFTALWRKDQQNMALTPLEMYILDSTLITAQLTPTRYPQYRLSTSTYGFNKEAPLEYWQVIHLKEAAWQGSAGFNKGTLAVELIGLDQDIDNYANFVMMNGAKPSGMFTTTQVIPDVKYKEIAARLKEAWASMTGSRSTDQSKPGQSILLDNGMTYTPIHMLTLQDAEAAQLKMQTMKRICGLFGVPPALIGMDSGKFNNTQTLLDEFYKSTMNPLIINIEQKFKTSLLAGYPNLCIKFQTQDFLKGAPIDQMNFAVAGISAGIMTPNEAREYLGYENKEGGDELQATKPQGITVGGAPKDITGSSPQDTGGGGNTSSVGKTGRAGKA